MTTNAVAAKAAQCRRRSCRGAAPAAGPAGAGGEAALKLSHAYLELFEPSKDGSLDKAGPAAGAD